jgi:para-nitrobenzyl esterase
MRPIKDLLAGSAFKQILQKSLLVTSIALLAACGSDDDAVTSYTGPVNDELVALSADTSPITIDAGNPAAYYANETYGTDARNLFDIYLPESTEPTGLIIYIHGGGFFAGDKALAYFNFDPTTGAPTPNTGNIADINKVLAAGIAFATINYSLLDVPGFSSDVAITENDTEGLMKSLSDVREALQYIRYNAKTFNIDPTNVSTYGVSAGASSSLWLAYSDDMAIADSEDPIAQQSTRIVAAGAIETQGSMDPVRWEEILFLLGQTLEGVAPLLLPLMESSYAIPKTDTAGTASIALLRAETGAIAEARELLDFPVLMDSSDAPVFVSNTTVGLAATSVLSDELTVAATAAAVAGNAYAADSGNSAKESAFLDARATAQAFGAQMIYALLHFPTHASLLKNYAIQAGAEIVANVPELGDPDQTQQTAVSFLLERM